jgi:hypothetical protein
LSAFDAAINTLFNDRNLAADAVYTPTIGASFPVRAVVRQPDAMSRLAEGLDVVSRGTHIGVRVSEVANPVAGDVVIVGGVSYTVQGVPKHEDNRRLTWLLDTHT